jgi:hypothetical protein
LHGEWERSARCKRCSTSTPRSVGELFHERRRQSGFPNAGLAREQYYLAFTGLCSTNAGVASQIPQGGQAARVQRLKAALNGTGPQRSPGPRRPGDALDFPGAEVLQLEKRTEKSSCVVGDDDSVWPRKRCQQGLGVAALGLDVGANLDGFLITSRQFGSRSQA